MRKRNVRGFLVIAAMLISLSLPAAVRMQIKGESLTPSGTRLSFNWEVQKNPGKYSFYLQKHLKAEMLIKNGKVTKIRRLVRYAGRDKWIVISDPLQISMELRSGFYPFAAVLNFVRNAKNMTVLATGTFEVKRSAAR